MNWNIFCRSSKTDFKFSFYDSVNKINRTHWHKATVASKNIYFSIEYLRALEEAMPGKIEFRYILFYNKKAEPVAAAIIQLLQFSGDGSRYRELLHKAGIEIKYKLPSFLDMKVMICGNIFSCGENGFAFSNEINGAEAYEILAKGLDKLKELENVNGAVSLIAFKEFWPHTFSYSDELKTAGYMDFMIDVNMVLNIRKSWDTFESYLESMTTRFRTKAKSVFRKSERITVIDLTKEDIARYKARIEELYAYVVERSSFSPLALNGEAFLNFKKELKNDFVLKGYFSGDKMIGFSSAFVFNNIADANYVGIDYGFNQQFALYQRMLYDLAELAITRKTTELRLGRTAEEIKSCMGAQPVDMRLYIRHGNWITNKMLKSIIESVAPGKFELRKPFKQVQPVPALKNKISLQPMET